MSARYAAEGGGGAEDGGRTKGGGGGERGRWRSALGRAWGFLRELSGEAALERRMRAHACAACGAAGASGLGASGPDAVKAAWAEAFDQPHRCC